MSSSFAGKYALIRNGYRLKGEECFCGAASEVSNEFVLIFCRDFMLSTDKNFLLTG